MLKLQRSCDFGSWRQIITKKRGINKHYKRVMNNICHVFQSLCNNITAITNAQTTALSDIQLLETPLKLTNSDISAAGPHRQEEDGTNRCADKEAGCGGPRCGRCQP